MPDSGIIHGHHSFGDIFQDPALYGLYTNGRIGHVAPDFDVSDFEKPFTETRLDLQQTRAFESTQHESTYSLDAYGLGQEYFMRPATMPPTALGMGADTPGFPPYNRLLDQQSRIMDATGHDNAPRFQCSFLGCTKSFKRSADRDGHSRKNQLGGASYHCATMECKYSEGKGFYRHDKLLSHERNVHKMHKE